MEPQVLTYGQCPSAKWTLVPQNFPSMDGRYLFNIEYNGTGLFLAVTTCDEPVSVTPTISTNDTMSSESLPNRDCHHAFPMATTPVLLTRTSPTLFELRWNNNTY
ncbi:unnamed protein product, partial [Amoebophrya sp. A25]|eukprot:GSA25T00024077001.1